MTKKQSIIELKRMCLECFCNEFQEDCKNCRIPIAIESIEKQIPKRPKKITDEESIEWSEEDDIKSI